MKKIKHEFAETMKMLGKTLKVKWALAVILVLVMVAVGLCGGNYHVVARITMSYFALICIESLAVGIWKLCKTTSNNG